MNQAANQTLGLVGAAALGAGVMFLMDPDRGSLRRARARRKLERAASWTAEKANLAASEVATQTKDLVDKIQENPIVAAILPERRSMFERLIAPRSRAGQVALVLLGTAIAAGGSTLAARKFS